MKVFSCKKFKICKNCFKDYSWNVLKAIQSIRRTDTENQIAGVPGMASRVVARVLKVVAMWLLRYLGWFLWNTGVVDKVLLCEC